MKRLHPRRRVLILALAVLLAFVAAGPAAAPVNAGPELDAIGQFSYRNAPYAVDTCGTLCTEMLGEQAELVTPTRQAIQLANLLYRARVIQRAPTTPQIRMAVSAFSLGWKIGTGLRKTWMDAPTPTTVQATDFTGATLFPAGQTMVGFWGQDVPAPVPGWLLDINGSQYFSILIPTQSPCPARPQVPAEPSGGMLLTRDLPQPAGRNCFLQPSGPWISTTPGRQGVMFIPAQASMPQVYTTQPFDYSFSEGSNTTLSATTPAVGTELQNNLDRYPDLLPWLNEVFDLIPFPDFIPSWRIHAAEFSYTDSWEYWTGADAIVRHGENRDTTYLKCERFDEALLYFDDTTDAIVIVEAGEIQTYYKPATAYDVWDRECRREE